MTREILTTDFKFEPYWWEAARPVPFRSSSLAASYDVAIIGSGYTGASAALALSRAGRSVAIFDKNDPGSGASRRSAGYIGRVLKKPFSEIAQKKGDHLARQTYAELEHMYQFTLDFIAEEKIECFAQRCGRLIAATSPTHLEMLRSDLSLLRDALGFDFNMISGDRLYEEFASPAYHGGAVIPDNGALHPGLYHQGLLDRALAAGTDLFGRAEVLGFSQRDNGYEVRTSIGTVRARHVIIGTNGYTPKQLGWYRRRVVPFRGFMAATEEVPAEWLQKIIPNNRVVIDSNTNIDFFRLAPDSRRILFGGGTGASLNGPESIASHLHAILGRILPDARELRLSHAWDGYCAGTFDFVPHMGWRGEVYHAMGYNFVGITTGTVFGQLIAQQILGVHRKTSVFENDRFPTLPFYTGNPWFLGLVLRYFDWKDRRIAANGRAR